MIYHYTYTYQSDDSRIATVVESISRHGYLGVEIFFMISGFVILWSAHGRTAGSFAKARALRLYPEFWICVLLSAVVFRAVPGGAPGPDSVTTLLANLTMLPQYLGVPYVDGVYWTLGVEIKFYFLVWLLVLARQMRFSERWLLAWVAGSVVASAVDVGGAARSIMIFPYGAFFAAGGLFFLVHDGGWSVRRFAGIAIAFAVCALQAVRGMTGFMDSTDITLPSQIVTVILIAAFFGAFATLVRRPLGMRFAASAATIGALTYPLYLLHNVAKELLINSDLNIPRLVAVPIAVGVSLLISYWTFRASKRWVHPLLKSLLARMRWNREVHA